MPQIQPALLFVGHRPRPRPVQWALPLDPDGAGNRFLAEDSAVAVIELLNLRQKRSPFDFSLSSPSKALAFSGKVVNVRLISTCRVIREV